MDSSFAMLVRVSWLEGRSSDTVIHCDTVLSPVRAATIYLSTLIPHLVKLPNWERTHTHTHMNTYMYTMSFHWCLTFQFYTSRCLLSLNIIMTRIAGKLLVHAHIVNSLYHLLLSFDNSFPNKALRNLNNSLFFLPCVQLWCRCGRPAKSFAANCDL